MRSVLFSLTISILMIFTIPVSSYAMYVGTPIDHSLFPLKFRISSVMFDPEAEKTVPTPDHVIDKIQDTFQEWERVKGVIIQFKYDGLYELKDMKKDEKGVIWVNLNPDNLDAEEGNPSGTGEQLRGADGRPIGGHIKVNTRIADFIRNKDELLRKVVLHEAGHALGLNHSPVSASIMSYRKEFYHNFLSLDDRDAVRQIYATKNLKGGTIDITATIEDKPAFQAQIILVDEKTGIGRFSITDEDGTTSFKHMPEGDYIVAAREIPPTGPCFEKNRTRDFLLTFYDDELGTNDPNEAKMLSVKDGSETSIDLPLIAGTKRYDCYHGRRFSWLREASPGYHIATERSQHLMERGQEDYIRILKDQAEKFDSHRTHTSGGVESGTNLIPAGTADDFKIVVEKPIHPSMEFEAETKELLHARLSVDLDSYLGPRIVYCENEGEYSITSVAFHVVDKLQQTLHD